MQNPYHFVRMEQWFTQDGKFEGFVGYTEDGNKYLTWDVREFPVFSGSCKVGSCLQQSDFEQFRRVFQTTEGRWIEPLQSSCYQVLGSKKTYYFTTLTEKKNHTIHWNVLSMLFTLLLRLKY